MGITIEKLRTWFILLGVVLVLVLVAFFAYARYRIRQVGRDLPQKLGLEIQQSTNNFTISKSSKGRTLFVLHASKAVQYKGGGRAVLHDVSIELYGTDGSRTDRITGSEFDYDPATKIVRAEGSVDILLSDPRTRNPSEAGKSGRGGSADAKAIHVKTQGLVFNQESQLATTAATLTFEQNGSSGSARGANYDGSKGTLSLTHDVVLQTDLNGEAVSVKAESASFDRTSRQIFLIQQSVDYQDRHGTSDQAIIFFRPDGKADHIRAEGHVRLRADDGSTMQASVGTAELDAAGTLQQVRLDGGLLYVSHGPVHSLHANSNGGVFSFVSAAKGGKGSQAGTAGDLKHVRLTGAVSVVDQQTGIGPDSRASETREIRAGQVDLDMRTGPGKQVQPDSALASGNSEVTIHTIRTNAPQEITKLKGDQLFATSADGHTLTTLRSTGNASLDRSTPGGISQTSHGDRLSVKFVTGPGGRQDARPPGRNRQAKHLDDAGSQIESALLSGHAGLVQQETSAGADKTQANADQISYQGSNGALMFTGGNPHIARGDSDLAAPVIEFNQKSGDAVASGGVKASYAGGTSPKVGPGAGSDSSSSVNGVTHVAADHASLNHAKDETVFYGSPHADARIWQGSNSISAPRIVLSRSQQTLVADGGVKANFMENGKAQTAGTRNQPRLIQTSGTSLLYSGGERKVTMSGSVLAHDAEGSISASLVELYLEQGKAMNGLPGNHPGFAPMGLSGQINRMIAQKNVRLAQGSRTGTGEKLVYTADDGHFLLTGTSTAPPLITDREHGTVTGSSLIFNDRDDSVVVSRGQSPTMTDSRTKSDPHGKNAAAGNHPTGIVQ